MPCRLRNHLCHSSCSMWDCRTSLIDRDFCCTVIFVVVVLKWDLVIEPRLLRLQFFCSRFLKFGILGMCHHAQTIPWLSKVQG